MLYQRRTMEDVGLLWKISSLIPNQYCMCIGSTFFELILSLNIYIFSALFYEPLRGHFAHRLTNFCLR